MNVVFKELLEILRSGNLACFFRSASPLSSIPPSCTNWCQTSWGTLPLWTISHSSSACVSIQCSPLLPGRMDKYMNLCNAWNRVSGALFQSCQSARFTSGKHWGYLLKKQNLCWCWGIPVIIGSWQRLPMGFADIYSVLCHSIKTKFKSPEPWEIQPHKHVFNLY